MPTTRQYYMREATELSVWRREQLLSGNDFIPGEGYGDPLAGHPILNADGSTWSEGFPGPPFLEDEAKAAWQEHKTELLGYHCQDPVEWGKTNVPQFGYPEPGGPGTRPWAWWWFDSPGPRQIVAVDADPGSFKSIPGVLVRQVGAIYESERDYLARHGLLSKAEIASPGAGIDENNGNPVVK